MSRIRNRRTVRLSQELSVCFEDLTSISVTLAFQKHFNRIQRMAIDAQSVERKTRTGEGIQVKLFGARINIEGLLKVLWLFVKSCG